MTLLCDEGGDGQFTVSSILRWLLKAAVASLFEAERRVLVRDQQERVRIYAKSPSANPHRVIEERPRITSS